MGTRSRFVATTLLVLIALGGAGLTVAADRQQTPDQRPEVMWAADQAAQPWIATLSTDLTAIDTAATALSKAGRDTLGNVQGLDGIAYIAHRGVNGSTSINVAINVIQISALLVFSVMALGYRMNHPVQGGRQLP